MTVPITSHDVLFTGTVQLHEWSLKNIIFPFPLLTESGLPIFTEAGKPLSIDSIASAIPLVGGTISLQTLHVITED